MNVDSPAMNGYKMLETVLVCPSCGGALAFAPDVVACTSCGAQYPRLGRDGVDLLADRSGTGGPWEERQEEMVGWYRDLVAQPSQATSCYANDYTPLAPILGRLSGTVLDLGGGNGLTRHYLPEAVRYIVIDPSVEWLAPEWTSIADEYPCLAVEPCFVRGVGESLPFRPGTFDAVLALWSMNHVSRPHRVFDEVARVLKPGGIFLIVLEDMEPALPDLLRRSFQRRAARQVARTIREDLPSAWCKLVDGAVPAGRAHDALYILLGKMRRILSRKWPVQSDHIYIREADLRTWAGSRFEVSRRAWIGQYLTYEFTLASDGGSSPRGEI